MPEPVEPTPEIARKNVIFGWTLFVIALVLFGGTIAVAYVYLAVD